MPTMKCITQFIRTGTLLSILSLIIPISAIAKSNQDNVLDFLPAILAASNGGGLCDPDDLTSSRANCTWPVTRNINLGGKTLRLPARARLEFNGGSIRNGTLIFNGGLIDGRLLSSSLELQGNAQLISTQFEFDTSKWAITEGRTSSANAQTNLQNLNKAIMLVHRLGAKIFILDKIDAYFDVGVFQVNAVIQALNSILIPSDFDFRMTNRTYLRVQPNNAPAYHLMSVLRGKNIRISGGHLLGDRWEHDYSAVLDINGRPRNTHDWGHVLKVTGGTNVLIEDIHLEAASGDAFGVNADTIRNTDGTPGTAIISSNVTIRNSVLTTSRRNNISITDCNGVLIENNQITDAALGDAIPGEYSSAGVAPRYGIDLEAYRERASSGELLEYEKIENVTIRGNTFTNNFFGDIDLFTASDIIIENNFLDGWIANVASHNVTIRNNTMRARLKNGEPFPNAILLKSKKTPQGTEFNYNYKIYGNTISGYRNAMILAGESYTVYDNTLTNFKNGMGIGGLVNSTLRDNQLSSTVINSIGYYSRGAETDNLTINDEMVSVTRHAIQFSKLKAPLASTGRQLRINGGSFISKTNKVNTISKSNNIQITGTTFNTDVEITESSNIFVTP